MVVIQVGFVVILATGEEERLNKGGAYDRGILE